MRGVRARPTNLCNWARAVGPPLGDTRLNPFKWQVLFKPVTLAQGSFLQKHPCVAQKDVLSNVEQGSCGAPHPTLDRVPPFSASETLPKAGHLQGRLLSFSSSPTTPQKQPWYQPQIQYALLLDTPWFCPDSPCAGSLVSELSPCP